MPINLIFTRHIPTLLVQATATLLIATLLPTSVHAGASPWVDIRIENGALLLDTSIAGIKGHAMVDTGSSLNAINRRFLAANSLSYPKGSPVRVSGVDGTRDLTSYKEVPVNILGSNINFKGLIDVRLGPPERQMLLGASFLSLYIFQFDYPNKRMRILTRDALDLKKHKNVRSKRDPGSGSPMVRVRLNDKKDLWLLLDTGATSGMLIDRAVASRNGWLKSTNTTRALARGIYSLNEVETLNIESVLIGGYEIGNPMVAVPLKNQPFEIFERKEFTGSHIRSKRKAWDGLLGYDVLKHFVVTVDFKGSHIHLEPGALEASAANAN